MSLFSRSNHSFASQWWWNIDKGLLGLFILLMLIGMVMALAASPAIAERIGLSPYYFVKNHILFLIPAFGLMLLLSLIPVSMNRKICFLIFIGSLFLLLLTLLIGTEIKGARRWIHLLGFSIQPSEFIKPTFAIFSAWLFFLYQKRGVHKALYLNIACFSILLGILIKQPDFGMSLILTAIWATQCFLAGLSLFWILIFIALAALGGLTAYLLLPHVTLRIEKFLNPAIGDHYQINKSLSGFHHGGFFGVGPGQGEVKLSLPDAHSDFIFSVIGEEFGMVWTVFIALLFFIILTKIFFKLREEKHYFIFLAVAGLMIQMSLQAIVNMGSALHLIPTKGMTLPFISYGGSSLLSFAIASGIILSFTRKDYREKNFD